MTPERIQEIYDLLPSITVKLSADPRLQGGAYICSKIQECGEQMEKANALFQEVHRALTKACDEVRLLKLQYKQEWEAEIVAIKADCSMEEKKLRAKEKFLKREQDERLLELRQTKADATYLDVPDLETRLSEAESLENAIRLLKAVLVEVKAQISQADHAVRLQNSTMQDEKRAVYGKSVTRRPEVVDNSEWEKLSR